MTNYPLPFSRSRHSANKSGFSLIELLVVATIMIVLMTIGIVSYQSASRNSRNSKRKTDLESVRQALVMYHNDGNDYPGGASESNPSKSAFNTMVGTISEYLSADSVVDPKDNGDYVYQYGSDGDNSFKVCASLETESGSTLLCLSNP